jgi:hypothetical protein
MANAMDVTTMVMLVLFTTIGATTASGTKARNGGGGGALPSLLWMVADDLGYTDLSYKGGEFPTPNLDALVSTSGCCMRRRMRSYSWPWRTRVCMVWSRRRTTATVIRTLIYFIHGQLEQHIAHGRQHNTVFWVVQFAFFFC